jgi:hypothetical protein
MLVKENMDNQVYFRGLEDQRIRGSEELEWRIRGLED